MTIDCGIIKSLFDREAVGFYQTNPTLSRILLLLKVHKGVYQYYEILMIKFTKTHLYQSMLLLEKIYRYMVKVTTDMGDL